MRYFIRITVLLSLVCCKTKLIIFIGFSFSFCFWCGFLRLFAFVVVCFVLFVFVVV